MSQNHTKARIEHIHVHAFAVLKYHPYQKAGKDRLKKITEKNDQTGFFPKNTQGVSGSRISASVISDINMIHFSIQIARLKQAERVSHCQA